jgi:hypothetical protein
MHHESRSSLHTDTDSYTISNDDLEKDTDPQMLERRKRQVTNRINPRYSTLLARWSGWPVYLQAEALGLGKLDDEAILYSHPQPAQYWASFVLDTTQPSAQASDMMLTAPVLPYYNAV